MLNRRGIEHLLLPVVAILILAPFSMNCIFGIPIKYSCSQLSGYNLHGASCLKVYTVAEIWAVAEASCVADGGHLASIHSREEQDLIANLAKRSNVNGPWIGLVGTPPNMAWSDGTDLDYENWDGPEPNATTLRCAKMHNFVAYAWKDIRCYGKCKYICQAGASATVSQVHFVKVPGGMDTNPAVRPFSTHTVSSSLECARRCQQDAQCVHFILSEDGVKYFCETYSSLYRPPLTAPPPSYNYQKVVV